MTETKPPYDTGVTDSGDAQPDAPGYVARFDAAYWQALVEQAQAERNAALRELADAQEDVRACLAELHALRGATEPELDTLRGKLTSVLGERDAALAQLASVKRQLAQTGDTLVAERRAAVAQQRRSRLD